MIEISKAAIAEIKRMQAVRQQTTSNVHIGFTSGGCQDFHYTIDLVDSLPDGNLVDRIDDISVSIDPDQSNYLNYLKLDYSEDLMGGGFRFQNPLAAAVCGCGNSFSISTVESERWQLPT